MCKKPYIPFSFGKTTLEVIGMFRQRRKNYRNVILASVLTAIALLSLILLLSYLGSFRNSPYEDTTKKQAVTSSNGLTDSIVTETERDINEEITPKQTYYLLKYDNDIVRVYFSDSKGNLIELEETDIVYETLSVEDQAQFQEGIQVENRDALNRLLMDYES